MGAISVSIDARKLDDITRLLANIKGGVPKALVGAINDTSKTTVTAMSRAIRERVNIKKKDIDRYIDRKPLATIGRMSGRVRLSESKRIGLKYFGARYIKAKKGQPGSVSYQIAKGSGRKTISNAFIGNKERLGEQVYKRLPGHKISKPRGPSPWGVFVVAGLRKKTQMETQALLEKNVDRRVNFLLLKQSGAIK